MAFPRHTDFVFAVILFGEDLPEIELLIVYHCGTSLNTSVKLNITLDVYILSELISPFFLSYITFESSKGNFPTKPLNKTIDRSVNIFLSTSSNICFNAIHTCWFI